MQDMLDPNDKLFDRYISLDHASGAHKDYVVVNWCIGNTCNYSCSYCPAGLHDGSVKFPSYEVVTRFCQRVMDHYFDKKVYFEFTGGEVTIWKDLPRVAKFLKEKGSRVGIISNGSRSENFWSQLVPLLDHVCLSFHPESGRPDHFFKIVSLCSPHIRTHVNLMMHPEHFPECLSLAYRVKELPDISLAIQPLVVDMGEELFPYTESQKRIIDTQNSFLAKQIKHVKPFESYRGAMEMKESNGKARTISPQRFISSGRNTWKGWTCYAGVEQIVVDMSGEFFRGWCLVGGALGKISDTNLNFPTTPVVCDKNYCHCNLDIMTRKVKRQPQLWQRLRAGMDGVTRA
jgi:organic radical activating enzyme